MGWWGLAPWREEQLGSDCVGGTPARNMNTQLWSNLPLLDRLCWGTLSSLPSSQKGRLGSSEHNFCQYQLPRWSHPHGNSHLEEWESSTMFLVLTMAPVCYKGFLCCFPVQGPV